MLMLPRSVLYSESCLSYKIVKYVGVYNFFGAIYDVLEVDFLVG
jgi:hypothetical protein